MVTGVRVVFTMRSDIRPFCGLTSALVTLGTLDVFLSTIQMCLSLGACTLAFISISEGAGIAVVSTRVTLRQMDSLEEWGCNGIIPTSFATSFSLHKASTHLFASKKSIPNMASAIIPSAITKF